MFRKGIHWLFLAGMLAAAGLAAAPARAADKLDFDQPGIDVAGIVKNAKKAAGESRDRDKGKPATQQPAAAQGEMSRLIIVFANTLAPTDQAKLVQDAGGTITHDLHFIHAAGVVGPKARMEAFAKRAGAIPEIQRIENDYYQNWLRGSALTAPPAARPANEGPGLWPWPSTAKQEEAWGVDKVHAQKAWKVTKGKGIKVAVVDTGIDDTHPDLKVAGGYNAIKPGDPYKDDNRHGTHVAGTIAGQGKDGGVFGVAPEVELWAVKVLDAGGSGTFADVLAGIQWCAENGVRLANLSLGADEGTQALADGVAAATKAGVAIIAAAGNTGGSVGYPAAYPDAIAVAAMDKDGKVADFSSRGPEVAVIAPGVDVNSTRMGGGYEDCSGTSMATPHVVGLAALAAAAHGLHGAQEIRQALKKAAAALPDVPPEQQGAGLPDAAVLVAPY